MACLIILLLCLLFSLLLLVRFLCRCLQPMSWLPSLSRLKRPSSVRTSCLLFQLLLALALRMVLESPWIWFWQMGKTPVIKSEWKCMLCVAVVFPQDLLEKGLAANNFAMLGLGDIVIPGLFIALLLRFDVRLASFYCRHVWLWYVSPNWSACFFRVRLHSHPLVYVRVQVIWTSDLGKNIQMLTHKTTYVWSLINFITVMTLMPGVSVMPDLRLTVLLLTF